MEDLLYDFKEEINITVSDIDVGVMKYSLDGYSFTKRRDEIEIKILLHDNNINWAVDWYSSQFLNGEYCANTKREIYVFGYKLKIFGSFIKSYSSIDVNFSELIIGCDYYERVEDSIHKNLQRDIRINELLS